MKLSGRLPLLTRGPQLIDDGGDALTIDLSELEFASPLELTGTAAIAQRHISEGRNVEVTPPSRPDIASYVRRMDLFTESSYVGARVIDTKPLDYRQDQSSVLLELRRVTTPAEAEDVATWFANVAEDRFGLGSLALHALGELLDNATTHGDSKVGAFVAAQFYSGRTSRRPGLELAVCDAGIGVLAHLTGNPKHAHIATSAEALHAALQPGISGTDQPRGFGLHDVLRYIGRQDMSGLILASGDAAIHRRIRQGQDTDLRTRLASPIAGTWAWLRVRLPVVEG